MLDYDDLKDEISLLQPIPKDVLTRRIKYNQSYSDISLDLGIPVDVVKDIVTSALNRAIWNASMRMSEDGGGGGIG